MGTVLDEVHDDSISCQFRLCFSSSTLALDYRRGDGFDNDWRFDWGCQQFCWWSPALRFLVSPRDLYFLESEEQESWAMEGALDSGAVVVTEIADAFDHTLQIGGGHGRLV